MVYLRVRGIHTVRAKGRSYTYHRASGRRIKSAPGTPEFLAEIAAAEASIKEFSKDRPGNARAGDQRISAITLLEGPATGDATLL